jgi:endonuclease YncB( thermonuclease family)
MFRLVAGLLLTLNPPAAAGERLAGRARVTDGDTLSGGGVAVRLKGVAAPEVAHAGDPGEGKRLPRTLAGAQR